MADRPPLDDHELDALLAGSHRQARDEVAGSLNLEAGLKEITDGPPTVLIVEDDNALAEALAAILQGTGFEVLGIAQSGEDAVRRVRENPPNVVSMDIGLAGMDGYTATEIIAREHPSSRVVMVTARSDRAALFRGLEAGAVGFLTKPFSMDELQATLHEAIRGGFPIAAAIMAATTRRDSGTSVHLFTPLEKTVLRYLADDLSIVDIAARTGLSTKEIAEVQSLIAEKINLRNAIENR
ncbi:response regulator [Kribbella sp. NPDC002412]